MAAGSEVKDTGAPKGDETCKDQGPRPLGIQNELQAQLKECDKKPGAKKEAPAKTDAPVTAEKIISSTDNVLKEINGLQKYIKESGGKPDQTTLAKMQNTLKTDLNQAIESLHKPDTAGSTTTPADRVNNQLADLASSRTKPGANTKEIDEKIALLTKAQNDESKLLYFKGAALEQGLIHAGNAPETGTINRNLKDLTEAVSYIGQASRSESEFGKSQKVHDFYSRALQESTLPFVDSAHPLAKEKLAALTGAIDDITAAAQGRPKPGEPSTEERLTKANATIDKFYKEQFASLDQDQKAAFIAIAKEAHMQGASYYYGVAAVNHDPVASHPLLADAYLRRAKSESAALTQTIDDDPRYQKIKNLTDQFEKSPHLDGLNVTDNAVKAQRLLAANADLDKLSPEEKQALAEKVKEVRLQSANYYTSIGQPWSASTRLSQLQADLGASVTQDQDYKKAADAIGGLGLDYVDSKFGTATSDGLIRLGATPSDDAKHMLSAKSQAAFDKWFAALSSNDQNHDTTNWKATQQAFADVNKTLQTERADLVEAQKIANDPASKAAVDAALMRQTQAQITVRAAEISKLNNLYTYVHGDDYTSADKWQKTTANFDTLQADYNTQRVQLTSEIKQLQQTENTQGLSAADAQYKKGLQMSLSMMNSFQTQRTWDQAFVDHAAKHDDAAHSKFKLLQDQLSFLQVTQSKTPLSEDPQSIQNERMGINQHSNGQNYLKIDANGNRFIKDDQHDYALLWMKPKPGETGNGSYYALENGHVYNYDINQHTKGAEVTGSNMPSAIGYEQGGFFSSGKFKFAHGVTFNDKGEVTDSDVGLWFSGHNITAQVEGKRPVFSIVQDGKETLTVGMKTTQYDPASQGNPPEPLVMGKGAAENNWGMEGQQLASFFDDPSIMSKLAPQVPDSKSGGMATPTLDFLEQTIYEPGWLEKHWKTVAAIGLVAAGAVLTASVVFSEAGVPMMVVGGTTIAVGTAQIAAVGGLFVAGSAGIGALGGYAIEGHTGKALVGDAAYMGFMGGISMAGVAGKALAPVVAPLVAPVAESFGFARPAAQLVNTALTKVSSIPYVGPSSSVVTLTGLGGTGGYLYGRSQGDEGYALLGDTLMGAGLGYSVPQAVTKLGGQTLVDGLGFGSLKTMAPGGIAAVGKNTYEYATQQKNLQEAENGAFIDFVTFTPSLSIATSIGAKVPALFKVGEAVTARGAAAAELQAAEISYARALESGNEAAISDALAARESAQRAFAQAQWNAAWRSATTPFAALGAGAALDTGVDKFPDAADWTTGAVENGISTITGRPITHNPMWRTLQPDRRFEFLNDGAKITDAMRARVIPRIPSTMQPVDPSDQ